jgi:NitT/TauT family transport system permease protein
MTSVETNAVTDLADNAPAPAVTVGKPPGKALNRLRPTLLAVIVPILLIGFWQVATTHGWTLLIPTPYQVAVCMVDFAVGGIYDDA